LIASFWKSGMSFIAVQKDKVIGKICPNVLNSGSKGQGTREIPPYCPLELFKRTKYQRKSIRMSLRTAQKDIVPRNPRPIVFVPLYIAKEC